MADSVKLESIPLSRIRSGAPPSRATVDLAQLKDLQRSLSKNGLKHPIAVRPVLSKATTDIADPSAQLYEIIAGERRYRAAVALGWKTIDCHVYPQDTSALETAD